MRSNCPFNYAGSKSGYKLLHSISEPVVDLFAGGGGFWSNCQSVDVIVNDISKPIIDLQKRIYDMTEKELIEFANDVEELTTPIKNDQQKFNELRASYNATKDPFLFYSLICTCTNNLMRFNGRGLFNQTWGRRNFGDSARSKLIDFHRRISGKKAMFLSLDFRQIVFDRLYFVDPPYLITGAGYNGFWSESDERNLYSFLESKRFILTNVVTRGDRTNTVLANFAKKYPSRSIRSGRFRAQKNQSGIIDEVIVCSDQELLNSVSPTDISLFTSSDRLLDCSS